jgi:hypothetical protein
MYRAGMQAMQGAALRVRVLPQCVRHHHRHTASDHVADNNIGCVHDVSY